MSVASDYVQNDDLGCGFDVSDAAYANAKVRPAELSSRAKDRSSNVNPYTFRVSRHDEKSRRTCWVKFKVILQIDSVRPQSA